VAVGPSAYDEAGVTVDSEGRLRGLRKEYEPMPSSSSRASMSTSISEPAVEEPSSSLVDREDETIEVRAGRDRERE